jgi:hypothetical protein
MARFENDHALSGPNQIARGGQTRHASPDDGDIEVGYRLVLRTMTVGQPYGRQRQRAFDEVAPSDPLLPLGVTVPSTVGSHALACPLREATRHIREPASEDPPPGSEAGPSFLDRQ